MATPITDQLRLIYTPPAGAPSGRVLIVSNRLPLTAELHGADVSIHPSDGGLVSALERVHRQSHGLWVGWPGTSGLRPSAQAAVDRSLHDHAVVPLHLCPEDLDGYYRRYSNEVLWPALHGRTPVRQTGSAWKSYRRVNERFAAAVARHARAGDRVWIHDYHLMLVPRLLRGRRPDVRIGFFLHTPFPDAERWAAVPQATELLDGLLGADVVGFHTRGYARAFEHAVRRALPYAVDGNEIGLPERSIYTFAAPIGIDPEGFAVASDEATVARELPALRGPAGSLLFVGVDRLDYTKGIPERLEAFERLLARRPELAGRARLVQLSVPSREAVAGYAETRARVDAIVARVNARFGAPGWTPVEHLYRRIGRETLVALYRAADVMLVTPLADGMNLVAKEFVAARTDEDGALVLSERAGAADELRAALLVDPTDVNGLARAYEAAVEMSREERRVRMRRLRRAVLEHDVFDWAGKCLTAMNVPTP